MPGRARGPKGMLMSVNGTLQELEDFPWCVCVCDNNHILCMHVCMYVSHHRIYH